MHFHKKPWGEHAVFYEQAPGTNVVVKFLHIEPHGRLSLQRHFHRKERWYVQSGVACVQVSEGIPSDADWNMYSQGSIIEIPCGHWHRVWNKDPHSVLSIVEVQTMEVGLPSGEDDIERKEDDYGRE